ncbi:MAG: L,D-transpeptidase [Nitrospirota bacterium]
MVQNINKILFIFALVSVLGCNAPQAPPEVRLAEEQEYNLWRSGAEIYVPIEYNQYRISLRKANEDFIREKSRFAWFRNYKRVESDFRDILQSGYQIQTKINEQKIIKSENISNQISFLKSRIETLKGLTYKINEGRHARKDLIKAELLLSEASLRHESKDYRAAEEKLKDISAFISAAEGAILPIFDRYSDSVQIRKWQRWYEDTVAESRDKRIMVIIVNKSERILTLYKNGRPFRAYNVGIGRNGSADKLHAGDDATPEGRYRIIKKLPRSRYHKALLINYPNEEDRKNFILAKRKGLIPARTGIGGLIEIHGGGKDSMTYGCISMDNNKVDEIFNIVNIGTPVTIIGAVGYNNSLSSAIEGLQ